MKTLLIPVLLLTLSLPALAKNDNDKGVKGAPGPVVGAGLPLLLIGGGIYWVVRCRKKATASPPT
jgi:hypothetical protein